MDRLNGIDARQELLVGVSLEVVLKVIESGVGIAVTGGAEHDAALKGLPVIGAGIAGPIEHAGVPEVFLGYLRPPGVENDLAEGDGASRRP